PAPVQELAYAFFRVASPENPSVSANLPWLRQLEASPPDWFAAARSAFTDGGSWTGFEPLLMACALGYALDDSPARFLEDLAGLAWWPPTSTSCTRAATTSRRRPPPRAPGGGRACAPTTRGWPRPSAPRRCSAP